ncbi:DHH family phosphoesterase [Candidatus Woesearchaeota archaeon]|nr:DHH family phosphoesterase [Candidatus Woesearchaeota archaeon]
MDNLNKLISLVKGKDVNLITHWDSDGVTSAAIIYHLIHDYAKSIHTSSKGDVFLVEKKDLEGDPDMIISVDIQPSPELDPEKTIYIDHHPHPNPELYRLSVHDPKSQSTSLLIWQELIPDTNDPYYIFLTLVGYFGDGGSRDNIPEALLAKANSLIPDLMHKRPSHYNGSYYYDIERYVSLLNTGKRMHWSGDIPLEMLKNIKHHDLFINNIHPIANELESYKQELRTLYGMNVELNDIGHLQYGIIQSERNIQGVLCARFMKEKPVLVLNKFNGSIIGSLRVPDELDFDAGKYLAGFNAEIDSFVGGGHEKAGGLTIAEKDLDKFIGLLNEKKNY